MTHEDSIGGSGHPICFRVADGERRGPLAPGGRGREVVTVEARMLSGHQKEAVIREGAAGPVWRVATDEGRHLKGLDVAPFPLGYFNAGLHGDLHGRIGDAATARGVTLRDVALRIRNFYWLTGSFVRGDGEGHVEPSEVEASIDADASPETVEAILEDAMAASPAFAAMASPLVNTFALYANGVRREIGALAPSPAPDAVDPYARWAKPPAPDAAWRAPAEAIRKLSVVEPGEVRPAPATAEGRIVRTVAGVSRQLDAPGVSSTDTWLEMPGVSHFALGADARSDGACAPTGLALLSAGVAFCYMTQLARYIEHMKLGVSGVRLVQTIPFAVDEQGGRLIGRVEPADTHLFLNGRADPETHAMLTRVGARTCYLHATLSSAVPARVLEGWAGDPARVAAG